MIGFAVAGISYYTKFVDQRDNNQPKIDAAVVAAEETQRKELEAEFAEKEKEPNRLYTGPAELGSVKISYPKTWSAFVDGSAGREVQFYGHPSFVPADGVNYALRMSVVSREFSSEIKRYDAAVKKGDLKASAVRISGKNGVRLDGFLKPDQEGSMVIFQLRDKTLSVWTESKDYRKDFNNIVIKQLSFVP